MSRSVFSGWYSLPFTAYHGRIPFIVVDLLEQLRRLNAIANPDLFNEPKLSPRLWKTIEQALNEGPISDWSSYTDIATLSVGFLRYLREMCAEVPLMEPQITAAVIPEAESEGLAKAIRRALREAYPGRHRILAFVSQFLSEVQSLDEKKLYRLFAGAFFGALIENPATVKVFHAMIGEHSQVFTANILRGVITLTAEERDQIARVEPKAGDGGAQKSALASRPRRVQTVLRLAPERAASIQRPVRTIADDGPRRPPPVALAGDATADRPRVRESRVKIDIGPSTEPGGRPKLTVGKPLVWEVGDARRKWTCVVDVVVNLPPEGASAPRTRAGTLPMNRAGIDGGRPVDWVPEPPPHDPNPPAAESDGDWLAVGQILMRDGPGKKGKK
jgi:hypothetical protein